MIVLPLIGLVILLCLELFGGFWGCFLDIVAFWRGVPVFRGVLLADLLTSITYAFSGIPLSVIRLINRHEVRCLKYFSSIVLQVFSTLHAAHSSSLAWWIVWLLVAILNSLYSWYWDVWRDWQLTRRWANAGLRPNQPLVFKWVFYTWFFLSDLGMRFYWGYKISRSSQPHYSWTAFLYAGIEVLRRSQWAYFRVEREAEEREAEGAV
ncbi:hypothetical protein MKW94_029597 [Papaver nudicaule]|uniref:EXS domain-containing protein n=1 Tax=Papaver nudicaule TaxID=74823 RepID=A0AA41S4V0_PAPNU|nr:hypothetical protein [Papaver nudicaule]